MTDAGSQQSSAPEPAARRWPRLMGFALVASLAFNLLVVGVFAAAAWRHRFGPPMHARGQATVLDFTRTLPDERRRMLLEATNAERLTVRPFRAEIRRARADVRATLQAEPFDAERFKGAQDRLLAAETRARNAAQSLIHAVVLKMSPQERSALAQWQRAAERPWRQHRGQKGEPPDEADPPSVDNSTLSPGQPSAPKQ